jgi:hypothetical protein
MVAKRWELMRLTAKVIKREIEIEKEIEREIVL